MCRCTGPGRRIACQEGFLARFLHNIFLNLLLGLFFWLCRIGSSSFFRPLLRLGLILFAHENRTTGFAKSFARSWPGFTAYEPTLAALLADARMDRRSLVTSIAICKMDRNELKDSSDNLSASRS